MADTDNLKAVVDMDRSGLEANSETIEQMGEVLRLSNEELNLRKIIYPGMAQRGLLNSFRQIRTQLLQKSNGENFITLVTSVVPEGGSSFVSVNIGASFALAENKTSLIIDCNLYDPSMADLLTIQPDYGLTDYLQNPEVKIEDIIYSAGIPRLRVVPVGQHRESAVEFFTKPKMKSFLQQVKERYPDRYIILDVAPVSTSTDARILLSLCDNVVLVVPGARVTESQVLSAIDAIGKDKLAGVVFDDL